MNKLFEPEYGPMRVAGFMSGNGTNLRRLIERERRLASEGTPPYEVVVLFSDSHDSNAPKIGRDFDIPVITRDIKAFYSTRGKPLHDMRVREEFDMQTLRALDPYNVHAIAYGGYMSLVTAPLIDAFVGVNVHPGDLRVIEEGERKFAMKYPVRFAIQQQERVLYSCTHLVTRELDAGPLLFVSEGVSVEYPAGFDPNDDDLVGRLARDSQEQLKVQGDWIIFPKTIEYLAQGRFVQDDRGQLYCDGESIPEGLHE